MADKENQFQGVVESLLKGMDTVSRLHPFDQVLIP